MIVLARGGGSVEDLLPFSDETLCRAVAACRTPVVSAIGHEPDTPLVDHVADVRCSTPTEAGRRLVPDLAEETARIAGLRDRARRALHGWVDREQRLLAALRGRPVLADPLRALDGARGRGRAAAQARPRLPCCAGWTGARTDLAHVRARLTALGPAATLARGYAIVQRVPATAPARCRCCARSARSAPGDRLRIRVGRRRGAPPTVTVDGAAMRRRRTARRPTSERARSGMSGRRSTAWATSRPATSSPRSCARWRPAG